MKSEVRSQIAEVNASDVGCHFCNLTSYFCNPALLHVTAGIAARSAAYRKAINFESRNAHSHGHGLSVFAARSHAFVEFEIVADHGYARQHVRTVADQGCTFDRRGDM